MTPREEILEALIEELRSLQQLHEYEEDAALAVSRARLNEILAKHELVPIDNSLLLLLCQMCFVWVDSIYLGNPSHPKYGYPAIEWRPITVTDSIIKKLEVYIENNGTVAPFLQSEKDDIRLEVLDEVGKLEEENAAHVSLLKTYSERIAGLEDKLRWRDCK